MAPREIMHHLKRSGPTVNDDRVAVFAHGNSRPSNGPFSNDIYILIGCKRSSGCLGIGAGVFGLCTTAHAVQFIFLMQGGNITANSGFGRFGKCNKFVHGYHRFFLQNA